MRVNFLLRFILINIDKNIECPYEYFDQIITLYKITYFLFHKLKYVMLKFIPIISKHSSR
jgi:hypothetical protein